MVRVTIAYLGASWVVRCRGGWMGSHIAGQPTLKPEDGGETWQEPRDAWIGSMPDFTQSRVGALGGRRIAGGFRSAGQVSEFVSFKRLCSPAPLESIARASALRGMLRFRR